LASGSLEELGEPIEKKRSIAGAIHYDFSSQVAVDLLANETVAKEIGNYISKLVGSKSPYKNEVSETSAVSLLNLSDSTPPSRLRSLFSSTLKACFIEEAREYILDKAIEGSTFFDSLVATAEGTADFCLFMKLVLHQCSLNDAIHKTKTIRKPLELLERFLSSADPKMRRMAIRFIKVDIIEASLNLIMDCSFGQQQEVKPVSFFLKEDYLIHYAGACTLAAVSKLLLSKFKKSYLAEGGSLLCGNLLSACFTFAIIQSSTNTVIAEKLFKSSLEIVYFAQQAEFEDPTPIMNNSVVLEAGQRLGGDKKNASITFFQQIIGEIYLQTYNI